MLIEKDELDVHDISLNELLKQLETQLFEEKDWKAEEKIPSGSEGLYALSCLSYLKSKRLLPFNEEPDPEESPYAPNLEHLLEYRQYKEAAVQLSFLEECQDGILPRQPSLPDLDKRPLEPLPLEDFAMILHKLMRKAAPPQQLFEPDTYTVNGQMDWILETLAQEPLKPLIFFFHPDMSKNAWVTTFLALLEMMKESKVVIGKEQAPDDVGLPEVKNCYVSLA